MHIVTSKEPIDLGSFGVRPPGHYLCTDRNAFEIGLRGRKGMVEVQPFISPERVTLRKVDDDHIDQVANPIRSVLVLCNGAKGDLLFLSPVLRQLQKLGGEAPVSFKLSCFPTNRELFHWTPLEACLIDYPVPLDEAETFDRVIALEDTLRVDNDTHATDLFAQALNVPVIDDYCPSYVVLPQEHDWAVTAYPKTRARVGLQLTASVANRNYPLPRWLELFPLLIKRNWEIMVFGHPGQYPKLQSGASLRNLTLDRLSFRQSAAVLSTCDAFCGIDSIWVHMCQPMDIPAVGLYGPFHWSSRTGKAPKTIAISGHGDCAPCRWHRHMMRDFPPNKPCTSVGKCVVLDGIEPERLAAKIDSFKPCPASPSA